MRVGSAWRLLLMVASQVYVAGSVASWTVAGAFGQRRFVCLTVVLVIGLAALLGGAVAVTREDARPAASRPIGGRGRSRCACGGTSR